VSDVIRENRPQPTPDVAESAPTVTTEAAGADGAAVVRSAGSGWGRAFRTGLTLWAAAQTMYFLINGLVWMARSEAGPQIGGAWRVWDRWDTGHYVTLALHGYNPSTENPAFFPLYPLLMRILEPVLPGGMLSAGLIISWICCIAALTVIHRLVEDLFDTDTAQRTALVLIAFPFGWYLCAAYPTSLFIALSVASLYCMRRGHWWLAGMWAGLASGARQAGVLLAVAFVIEYLRQRDWDPLKTRWNAAAIGLVPTGLIAFMLYSWHLFGDPLKFVHIQSYWGRSTTWPWTGAVHTIQQIIDASKDGAIFQPVVVLDTIDLLSVPFILTLLVLSVVGPWRLGPQCWYLIASATATYLAVLVSPIGLGLPPLHGVPRYALEILPAFLVLARITANRTLERLYLLPALGLQGALVLIFFFDIWLS
jgi:Gpi18-like mannosyltransferase